MYYTAIRKASLSITFDEETCKFVVDQVLEGTVEKVEFSRRIKSSIKKLEN